MIVLFIILLLIPSSSYSAVTSLECLECHSSVKISSHKNETCTNCHNDIKELPHGEKLEKPSCRSCHQDTSKIHDKSVHNTAGMGCRSCHTIHSASKEKKRCISCHKKPSHNTLPSKTKHLASLECISCHSRPAAGSINIKVTVPKEGVVDKATIDRDKNNRIDGEEWDNLQLYLKKHFKNSFQIKKNFDAPVNIHAVTKKPLPCASCHTGKELFGDGVLKISGHTPFNITVEKRIFIPELPDSIKYRHTYHGEQGVRCKDCHMSQERISDTVCINCHKDVYKVYKGTSHAKKGAIMCMDCHNPHSIKPYKELNAVDRVNVCARCHTDYMKKHEWLPNTLLHFKYLECSTCHSPGSTKSIIFYAAMKYKNKEVPLNYPQMEQAYRPNVNLIGLVDRDRDNTVTSEELSHFFQEMSRNLNQPLYIGSSIIVTKVHHNYSEKEKRERVCSTCHSDRAPFYDSMFLILPGKSGQTYIPVKGTILSALPTSLFIGMCLLGETRITREDWQKIMRTKGKERADFILELGFKWIDLAGIVLIVIISAFIGIHIVGRIIFKR